MGYHDNAIYPYVDLDTGIDDTESKQKLEDLINSIDPLGITIDPDRLVGDSSLINGGIMGRLLRLVRVHLEEAKDKNELSEEVSGEVYGKLMEASLSGAIDFLFKNEQLKISDREASAKLIHALQESRSFDLDFEKSQIERQKIKFEVNHFMPLQREEMVENIEFLHLKHLGAQINNDIDSFKLTSILPKESDKLTLSNTNLGKSGVLLDDDHDLKNLDKTSKNFTNTQILPKESLKLTKGNTILDDNHDLLVLDKTNKDFVNTSIQPKEASLLTDNHDLNVLEKANKAFINTSIQPKEAALLSDKHDLNVLDEANKLFTNTSIQPKEAALLTDKHDLNTLEKTNKSFVNTNIQPKELALLIDKHDLNTLEKTNKSFVNTSIQPKEATLLTDKHNLNVLDAANKSFTNTSIQPKEAVLLTDRHDLSILEKANKSFVNTNIQPKEATLLDDKHDLSLLEKANKSFINTDIQPKEAVLLDDKHDSNVVETEIREYYKDFIQVEEKLTMIANRKIAEEKILLARQELLLGAKEIELKTKQIVLAGKEIELKTKQILLDEKKIVLAEKEIEVKVKQILLDEKKILIAEKELEIKAYELATMLPAQVAKINAEITNLGHRNFLLDAQTVVAQKQACIANFECLIKEYYQVNMQTLERDLLIGKSRTARILAGLTGDGYVNENSLAFKQIEQMAAQTDLYTKQGDSYEDKKDLDLLKIQANYASMIFSDLENPAQYTLAFGDNPSTDATYQRLIT